MTRGSSVLNGPAQLLERPGTIFFSSCAKCFQWVKGLDCRQASWHQNSFTPETYYWNVCRKWFSNVLLRQARPSLKSCCLDGSLCVLRSSDIHYRIVPVLMLCCLMTWGPQPVSAAYQPWQLWPGISPDSLNVWVPSCLYFCKISFLWNSLFVSSDGAELKN